MDHLVPFLRPQLGNRVDSGLILPDSDLQALKPSALPTNVSNPGSTPEQKSEPVILSEDDDSVLPVPDIKIIGTEPCDKDSAHGSSPRCQSEDLSTCGCTFAQSTRNIFVEAYVSFTRAYHNVACEKPHVLEFKTFFELLCQLIIFLEREQGEGSAVPDNHFDEWILREWLQIRGQISGGKNHTTVIDAPWKDKSNQIITPQLLYRTFMADSGKQSLMFTIQEMLDDVDCQIVEDSSLRRDLEYYYLFLDNILLAMIHNDLSFMEIAGRFSWENSGAEPSKSSDDENMPDLGWEF